MCVKLSLVADPRPSAGNWRVAHPPIRDHNRPCAVDIHLDRVHRQLGGFALLPGPNVVVLLTRSLAHGPSSAWRSALGVETATATFALLAAALAQVIAPSAALFGILKWAGVAYLC